MRFFPLGLSLKYGITAPFPQSVIRPAVSVEPYDCALRQDVAGMKNQPVESR